MDLFCLLVDTEHEVEVSASPDLHLITGDFKPVSFVFEFESCLIAKDYVA